MTDGYDEADIERPSSPRRTPGARMADPIFADSEAGGDQDGVATGEAGDARSDEGRGDVLEQDMKSVIASELVPRLMLLHAEDRAAARQRNGQPQAAAALTSEHAAEFLSLILEDDAEDTALAFLDGLVANGVPQSDILLSLLPATARRLGEMWDDDERNLADVTISLCRLHSVLRSRQWFDRPLSFGDCVNAPSVVLGTLCGDQHMFGLVIVAEVFSESGWRVAMATGSDDALIGLLSKRAYNAVGLSASSDLDREAAAAQIAAIRQASKNPDLKVFVGGVAFDRDDGLAERLGADMLVQDVRLAPATMQRLLVGTGDRC